MPELPSVSALVAAYNYERYVARAIESALVQDYPSELIEIVVVDDGSTDGTAGVVRELIERHPRRQIKLVSQANGGLTATMNRCFAEADGELLAILDADDMWMPHKVRRNVELFAARPEVGLVHSDMVLIGPDDEIRHPSLFTQGWGAWRPPTGRIFARLLAGNFATASSIVVRASARHAFSPIPAEIPYPDWWLAMSVARVAEVARIDEPLALYRLHDANLTGGLSGGEPLVRERRKELAFQIWCLRNLPLDSLDAADALEVWSGVEEKARNLIEAAGSPFALVADGAGALRDPAEAQVDDGVGDAEPDAQSRALLRALAFDPYRLDRRRRLFELAQIAAMPDPLAGSRRFVTLVDAEDLLAGDGLLVAYASELAGATDATLAIDASRLPPQEAVSALRAAIERCGLVGREDVHLLAVVGELHDAQRRRMLAGAQARYRADAAAHADGEVPLPSFTPATLTELRALAA
jgi:hypothetical protein